MSGYARDEILGYPVEVLLPERLRPTHERARMDFFSLPRNRPMGTGLDTRLLRKDGGELRVEIQLCPAEVEGAPAVIAAVRDVSERKAVEQVVRTREEEFARLAERERIGGELVSSLIHSLFGIGLRLQGVSLTTEDDDARAGIDGAITDIDEVITELRGHVYGLRRDDPD